MESPIFDFSCCQESKNRMLASGQTRDSSTTARLKQ